MSVSTSTAIKPQTARAVDVSKSTVYYKSDNYFNDHDDVENLEAMGFDVQPVDVFGGFVPEDKSMSNLKKNEAAIQKRFKLEKPE